MSKCQGGVVYNSITDPEACCEACVGLTSLNASTHADDTACAAFQIRNGRCQILREHFVTSQFGSAGLAAARPRSRSSSSSASSSAIRARRSRPTSCSPDRSFAPPASRPAIPALPLARLAPCYFCFCRFSFRLPLRRSSY